jgi:hypothetical protein
MASMRLRRDLHGRREQPLAMVRVRNDDELQMFVAGNAALTPSKQVRLRPASARWNQPGAVGSST